MSENQKDETFTARENSIIEEAGKYAYAKIKKARRNGQLLGFAAGTAYGVLLSAVFVAGVISSSNKSKDQTDQNN
jgi:hypothetical protein